METSPKNSTQQHLVLEDAVIQVEKVQRENVSTAQLGRLEKCLMDVQCALRTYDVGEDVLAWWHAEPIRTECDALLRRCRVERFKKYVKYRLKI